MSTDESSFLMQVELLLSSVYFQFLRKVESQVGADHDDDTEMTKGGRYLGECQTRTRSCQARQHFHCPWQSPRF